MSIKKFSIGSAQVASFKEQLTKGKQGGGGNPNFLKLEGPNPTAKKAGPTNLYKLRLIPHPDDVKNNVLEKSIFHYKSHGWKSNKTGQWVTDNICPTTFGEGMDSNPIILYSVQQYKKLKEQGIVDKKHPAREALKKLGTKENWLVNVYIIDDPVNPENKGTVKILKMGKNLYDMVMGALEDELFGPRILSLAEDGCVFRIKVGWNGDTKDAFQTYAGSAFEQVGTAIPNVKTDEEIYSKYIDMPSQFTAKTRDELKALVTEHYLAAAEVASGDVDNEQIEETATPVSQVTPKAATKTVAKKAATKKVEVKVNEKDEAEGPSEAELDDLLDQLPD